MVQGGPQTAGPWHWSALRDHAIAKPHVPLPSCVFLSLPMSFQLTETDSCSLTFSVISTSEFDHKLGFHVSRKKYLPCAEVNPNYNWCFSMDTDQKAAFRLYGWTACGRLCQFHHHKSKLIFWWYFHPKCSAWLVIICVMFCLNFHFSFLARVLGAFVLFDFVFLGFYLIFIV